MATVRAANRHLSRRLVPPVEVDEGSLPSGTRESQRTG